MTGTTMADAAKALQARGFRIAQLHTVQADGVSCTCRKARACLNAGKHPRFDTWQSADLWTDEQIDGFYGVGFYANFNVGIVTGRESGVFALDVDVDRGGLESLKGLQERYGRLRPAAAQRTGGGGLHDLFAWPDDFEITNRLGGLKDWPGIDVRGQGGQIVAAPSVSAKGPYSWIREGVPGPAPEWLLALLQPVVTPSRAPVHSAPRPPADDVEGQRLAAYTGSARGLELGRLQAMATAAVAGGVGYVGTPWNSTVFEVCCSLTELAGSDWAPYSLAEARADVLAHAPRDAGFADTEILKCWESARAKVGSGSRSYPAARQDTASMVASWANEAGVRLDPILRAVAASTGAAQSVERPALDVSNAAVMADWLAEHLGRGRDAGYFRRGGEMVHTPRIGEDGYLPPSDGDDDGPAQVRRIDAGALQAQIQYRYACHRTSKDGERSKALFPRSAATVAVDGVAMLPHLRTLRGVIHTPTIRADGSILAEPGYDAATGLLHLPEPGLVVPDVSAAPSSLEVAAAAALLERMFCDFRFATEHDKANLLGLLLTPTLRAIVPPPYKLGAIGAPQPGAGKTLVATVLRIVHGGVFRAEMPSDDNELRKVVTSILDVTTGAVVHFDNATGVLRSSTLAALLTSGLWEDRRLGGNEMVSRPNDRLYVVTGNNLALGGDLLRRAVFVTIDPGVPNPHLRTAFAIPNLESWVREHRGQIIHALLTLVRAWVAAGRPNRGRRSSDGYGHWVETVDGILQHAGIAGTFDDPASAGQEVGSDDDEWRDLLAAIHATMGSSTWTAKDLLARVDTFGCDPTKPIPVDALPGELAEKLARSGTGSLARPFGMWLRNRAGRWAGPYSVRQAGKDRANVALWRVEAYENAADAGTAGTVGSKSNSNTEEKLPLRAIGESDGSAAEWELLPAVPAVPAADPWRDLGQPAPEEAAA